MVHAGTLLRRQLQRRLSDDPVEQSWYWIDLAHGLRRLNRAETLPNLLRCPANAPDAPLSQFFAAETVCCAGFVDYLRRPLTPLGRNAMRVLYQTLVGLRHGFSRELSVTHASARRLAGSGSRARARPTRE